MKSFSNSALSATLLISLALNPIAVLADGHEQPFEFSGFMRLAAGYLDESNATFAGYDDSISIDNHSLLGVQADYRISDNITLAAQLLAHSNDDRNSGVEWLYANFTFDPRWQMKVGRLRTPFFRYSNVIDVGFAYPWVTTPTQLYNGYVFTNFDGVNVSYQNSWEQFNFNVDAYWGVYDDTVSLNDISFDLDIGGIGGVLFTVQQNNTKFRLSYNLSNDLEAHIEEFAQLSSLYESAGFARNAEAFLFNDNIEAYLVGFEHFDVDYFVAAEFIFADSNIPVVASFDNYYVTAGLNFPPYQIFATYASADAAFDFPDNEVPLGLSPQLDQLYFVYETAVSQLPVDNLDSIALGARWDITPTVALKVEVTWLDGQDGTQAYFAISDPQNFDRKATLYQISVDWVF